MLKAASVVALSDSPASLDESRCELARLRQLARVWAATISEPKRRDMAALLTRAAFESYAAVAYPNARLSGPFSQPDGKLTTVIAQLAKAIGKVAAQLSLSEAAYALSGLYTTLLESRERSVMGAFYTPPALADRLLDMATEEGIDWATARVLDPASGGGAFLLPAALRMRAALAGTEPAFILAQLGSRLSGLELDVYAAWFGQASLELALSDLALAANRPVPVVVTVADTIEEDPQEIFDLVVGNPPYGRVTLTSEQRQRYRRSLYGHANLYGIFTDIAIRWTKPSGVIAYLTPTSFLGGQYYAALRSLLASEAPPVGIDFVQARKGVFEDVLQETLLATYRRGVTPGRVQVHYVQVKNEREANIVRNGTIALPPTPSEPWMAPREPKQAKLVAIAETMPSRLSDWGYVVSTGPLVWNRYKSQMRDCATVDTHPIIWAEAVTADGRFVYRAEKRNHAPYFKVERPDGWLVVNQSCVLVQRTTAKEQARRLIAAELPVQFILENNGVIVENHLNMVRPIGNAVVTPATVAAILNSCVVDQLFRCISGSVAVSAFELEAIPLPAPDQMKKVEALVHGGAEPALIEIAIAALYGQRDMA